MAPKNQRGQIMMEIVLILFMFAVMFTQINFMAQKQRSSSNKYKLSKSIGAR